MTILALDASTKNTGWAVFQDTILQDYGCISAASADLINRINKMTKEIEKIITKYNIDKIILEEVRPEQGVQNLKTHRALMYLQAAITFLVHDNFPKVEIEMIYPSQWRKACGITTGRGVRRESLKPKDVAFVKKEYNIDVNDDVADSIGIGHAYVFSINNEINWE